MYILSPYLRFIQTPSGYMMIYNFLLDKLQDLSTDMLPILKFCVEARTKRDILAHFKSKSLLDRMIANYQIVSAETIWQENFCNILEIETSTLCSWKCEYCPVRSHTRPVKFIDPDLFSLILHKAEDYGYFKQISLTSYNEASLDDNFVWYLQEIRRHGFDLLLYSNGSYLTQDKLNAVQAMKEHAKICFNLPSLNRARFEHITVSKTFDRSIAAIDSAIEKGIRVTIIVQGDHETREVEQKRIQKRFPKAYVATYASNNRGAAVFNSYIKKIKIPNQRLTGCYMVTRHVCLTVNGDMMLCCNDFYHANLFGNIRDASFQSLLTSEKAVTARKATWGGCQAGEGHLCRVCTLMEESITQDRFVEIDKVKSVDMILFNKEVPGMQVVVDQSIGIFHFGKGQHLCNQIFCNFVDGKTISDAVSKCFSACKGMPDVNIVGRSIAFCFAVHISHKTPPVIKYSGVPSLRIVFIPILSIRFFKSG